MRLLKEKNANDFYKQLLELTQGSEKQKLLNTFHICAILEAIYNEMTKDTFSKYKKVSISAKMRHIFKTNKIDRDIIKKSNDVKELRNDIAHKQYHPLLVDYRYAVECVAKCINYYSSITILIEIKCEYENTKMRTPLTEQKIELTQSQRNYEKSSSQNQNKFDNANFFLENVVSTNNNLENTLEESDRTQQIFFPNFNISASRKVVSEKKNDIFFVDKRDGQKYRTVKIGNQIWMAENLRYKHSDSFVYNNLTSNGKKYGRLYNWYSAMESVPKGWKLPSYEDLKKLLDFLDKNGFKDKHAFVLKSKTAWSLPDWNKNLNGIDSFGFSAFPSGMYDKKSQFEDLGHYCILWCSTDAYDLERKKVDSRLANVIHIGAASNDNISIGTSCSKTSYYSMRCIKENSLKTNINEYAHEGYFIDERDGIGYKTTKIGNQVWMAENLIYDHPLSISIPQGRIYSREISVESCPKGWHIPCEEEWKELINFLGKSDVADKLKSKLTWPNLNKKKLSGNYGFNAVTTGFIELAGEKRQRGTSFWSFNKKSSNVQYSLSFRDMGSEIEWTELPDNAQITIRCIKD